MSFLTLKGYLVKSDYDSVKISLGLAQLGPRDHVLMRELKKDKGFNPT